MTGAQLGGVTTPSCHPQILPQTMTVHVSVAAENVVGVGVARTCTTQTISELISFLITFKMIRVSSVLFVYSAGSLHKFIPLLTGLFVW